jgi:hypothetical protein
VLSEWQQIELSRIAKSRSLPAGYVFRARLILMLAEGASFRTTRSKRQNHRVSDLHLADACTNCFHYSRAFVSQDTWERNWNDLVPCNHVGMANPNGYNPDSYFTRARFIESQFF